MVRYTSTCQRETGKQTKRGKPPPMGNGPATIPSFPSLHLRGFWTHTSTCTVCFSSHQPSKGLAHDTLTGSAPYKKCNVPKCRQPQLHSRNPTLTEEVKQHE